MRYASAPASQGQGRGARHGRICPLPGHCRGQAPGAAAASLQPGDIGACAAPCGGRATLHCTSGGPSRDLAGTGLAEGCCARFTARRASMAAHRTPPCSPNQSGASSHPAPGSDGASVANQGLIGGAACWIQRASPYSDGNIARIAEINTQEFCEVSIRLWTGSRITIDSIEVRFLVPSRLRDTLLPSIPDCDDRSRRCHKSLGSAREFYTRRHVGARQPTLHAL